MGILNIFSNKSKKKISPKPKQQEVDLKITSKIEKPNQDKPIAKQKDLIRKQGILIRPYFSEKFTLDQQGKSKYVFEVDERMNKNEIKKLVENIYKVKVLNVNILKASEKTKRWRSKKGIQKGNKKMIVTLKEGQKIELGI